MLRRQARGESVATIRTELVIPTGRDHPSLASIYRALAEHDARERHPDAVDQAHAEHAAP